MSAWDRLLALTAASPFTGTWMSLGTAFGALIVVTVLRRLLPPEDRQHGGSTVVLLSIGLVLGLARLLFVAAGAHDATVGKVVSVLTTFFVALGAVNTAVLFVFEVVPARARIEPPTIVRDLVQMLAFVVIVFGALSQGGLGNVTSFVTTSAVLTAVVGLALQSTIANLFAGIVLHMDRALGAGDWVQVGPRVGRIAQIRWRSTILRTTDGDTVIIPNGQITAQEVYNFSRPSPRHRAWLRIGFHYRHAPNEVRDVLREAARTAPGVLATPAPDVIPVEFGDCAVIYAVRYWIDDYARALDIEAEIRTRLWYAARRAGLEIPFPIRTIVQSAVPTADARSELAEAEVAERLAAMDKVDLFSGLEPSERRILAHGMHRVQFAAGEAIIRQGEPGDSLFLIARGDVLISIGQAGLNQSVTSLRAGHFFGEMSLATGEPRAATCSARTDVVCYVIDRAAFQRLLAVRPQIAEQVSALLAARQVALDAKGGELSARAAQAAEHKTRLLERIRRFFDLG